MKYFICSIFLLFLEAFEIARFQTRDQVLPTRAQQTWANAEVSAMFHFDVQVFEPNYEWRKTRDYQPNASVFNPRELDTDQWIRAAKSFGATYAVLVAKHCSGFSLWPTKTHEYRGKNSPWKNRQGDIVKDVIASCKKYSLKPELHASAFANAYCNVDNLGLVLSRNFKAQKTYNEIVKTQPPEPCSCVVSINCNAKINSEPKQVVSSEGLMRITQYNDSCMSSGLWTGAVVQAGTLKDGIVFSKSWGYLSVEKQTQMSENAIFDLASLTKPIATATALAICMDRKLVDISVPFTQYLSDYKGKLMNAITVQDLARHLSGFDNRKPYIKEGKVVENIMVHSPVRPVGEKYEYSCGNYILLGLIVERVTGELLDQFCLSNIFTPLKMEDTHWSPLSELDSQQIVKSKFTPKSGVVSDEPARAARHPIGNAGLFSTAKDLAKYCLMILQNGIYNGRKILSERAIKLLTTKPDSKSPVAFGWRVDSEYNPLSFSERTLSHTGFTGNSVWIDLDQKKFVIVLTNRTGDHERSSQARIDLAEHLLKEMKNN